MFASLGVIKETEKSVCTQSPISSRRAKSLKSSMSFKSLTPLLARKTVDDDSRIIMRRSLSPTCVSGRPFLSSMTSENPSLDIFQSFDDINGITSSSTNRSISVR